MAKAKSTPENRSKAFTLTKEAVKAHKANRGNARDAEHLLTPSSSSFKTPKKRVKKSEEPSNPWEKAMLKSPELAQWLNKFKAHLEEVNKHELLVSPVNVGFNESSNQIEREEPNVESEEVDKQSYVKEWTEQNSTPQLRRTSRRRLATSP